MIGASKILTVSYGTFSCTLEGFDEPFNTMKAIAEYFRDLAAEDRYFGAEPPTPDAAMLHKIAEREIQRRVEAKIQDNGVILRAEETPADGTGTLLPHATRSELASTTAPITLPPVAVAPVVAEAAPEPIPEVSAVSESVAAKLMRIRSAVAQSRAETTPAPDATYSEDEHADVPAAEDTIDVIATLAPEHAADVVEAVEEPVYEDAPLVEDTAVYDAEGLIEDAPAAEFEPEIEALPVAAPEVDTSFGHDFTAAEEEPHAEVYETAEMADEYAAVSTDDSIAALFADQAEVIAAADEDLLPEQDPEQIAVEVEDALPEDFADTSLDGDLPATTAEGEAAVSDADILANLAGLVQDDAAPYAEIELEDDLDEGDLKNLAALDAATPEDIAAAEELESFDLYDDLADQDDTPVASIFEADAVVEAETATYAAEPPLAPEVPEVAAHEEVEAENQPALSDKALRARARVIKIRRIEPAVVEIPAVEAPVAEIPAAAALSAEAEADLMRELADAEAEAPAPRPVRPSRPVSGVGRAKLEDTTGDAAVNRLIQQTNTEMEGPENRRRISAISHLKAAVIATVADRITGGAKPPTDAERIDPYRNDLSRMVRPLPPVQAAPVERAPTLVLVSEQRVDKRIEEDTLRNIAAQVGPTDEQPKAFVRPRRISAASNLAVSAAQSDDEEDGDDEEFDTAAIFTDTKGFIEFADRLGADNLPAMLEAAAAYSACVEGRPHFTRPQLLRQVSVATPEVEMTRENSLRGFGALLRAGKIAKVKRGQYALTESSHYLTEARKLVS